MRRPRERWAPVHARDEPWLGHVLDVEDHEAAVPVRDVEPVAATDRVMATVGTPLPARCLTADDPLARHPPAPDLFRPRGILEIEDHHDVAAVTLGLGREIGVAPVEREAMEALPFDEGDLARALRVAHVPDEIGRAHV